MVTHGGAVRGLMILVLGGILAGCVSLPTPWELRKFPGFSHSDLSMEGVVYDPAIRAYRVANPKEGAETFTGTVLRDIDAKKIRTEGELKRVLVAFKSPKVGTGTKIAAYSVAVVYSPIVVAENIAAAVLTLPLQPVAIYENHRSKRILHGAVEEAYAAGRSRFDAGELQAALDKWDDALRWDSSLRWLSDIDYWRGRAFERLENGGNALTAYLSFLDYSAQSFPSYFHPTYGTDPSWSDKAADTERRLGGFLHQEEKAAQ
jgi:hypothetical protein